MAELVPISMKKKGCFTVLFSTADNCDANPDLITTLNVSATDDCGNECTAEYVHVFNVDDDSSGD